MRDNFPPLSDAEVRALTRNARSRQRRQELRQWTAAVIGLALVAAWLWVTR